MRFQPKIYRLGQIVIALIGLGLAQGSAFASSVNSNTTGITLNAAVGESLTVTLTLSSVSFPLLNGSTVLGASVIPITTSWVLQPSRSSVKLYGSFASASAALSDGLATPNLIPSADVFGQMITGAPVVFTPFTQTISGIGAPAASLLLFNQPVSLANLNFVSTRTDILGLEIATPLTLPAGTYTGTLSLQAQAN